jgi:tetratricopeptide (TPR) repeat protein
MFAAFVAAAQPCSAEDPIALARAGTTAIEQRRFGDALQAFTRAATMRPADASICFGAGVAAFMLGQDVVAQSRFECALALNPHHLEAARWLGDLHYRAGRLLEAIATYENARQRSPRGSELQPQIDSWRKEYKLQSRFHELCSGHFTALFELDTDEPFARQVIERLEAAYARVGDALGAYPKRPITVVLYTREQFGEITRLAEWSAAAYDGRIRVPLTDGLRQPQELDRVLSHEYVHAVVATLGGRNVPAWVNEGLATVLESADPAEAETAPAHAPGPPMSHLHGSFVGFSARDDAEIAYASAARAVRRIVDQRGMMAIVALLADLGRGESFARAFSQRVAMRYEDFATLVARDY